MKMSRRTPILIPFLLGIFGTSSLSSQWVQTNGPYGGGVFSFLVSDTNIYVGTGGGVFLSTNNGANWTAMNEGLTYSDVRCLALSGDYLLAGTSEGSIF